MTRIFKYKITVCFALFIAISCKKFIEIPAPKTELIQQNVFNDDATALAAISSIYIKLADGRSFSDGNSNSVMLFEGLYSDELASFVSAGSTSPQVEFYFNNVTPLNSIVSSTWGGCYSIIYECNRMLEGLNKSDRITLSLRKQLSGEALFIRSFCHFYLLNLFGDIPLIINSDYRANTQVSRTPALEVYQQIIGDLVESEKLLVDNYPSAERVRVNKGAAIALLARVYLYANDFVNAEMRATEIINKISQYKLLPNLNSIFLKTSEEAIWQLIPRGGGYNYTNEGSILILLAPPTNWALRNELHANFESGDLRKVNWIDSIVSVSGLTKWYYPYKYKQNQLNASGIEYSMVLRLAEQYLIRAEARIRLNKLTGANSAVSDLNMIRSRAGLGNTTATTLTQLLVAIETERRLELFTEWGHRFFDLKRWGRLDAVLALPVKLNWNTTDALLPIPQSEILINGKLTQNPGY